jgi:phage tail sheath gpL-like
MALTSIGDARTPGRPIETTFAADLGQPNADQPLVLIAHLSTTGGTASAYAAQVISNSGDPVAGLAEANGYFGVSSEASKMVLAAINANAGGSEFPPITVIPLANADTGFGSSNQAMTALGRIPAAVAVSCYDGVSGAAASPTAVLLKAQALSMSSASSVQNNQFGTAGLVFNRSVTDPSTLPTFDSQYMIGVWLPDTGTAGQAPAYSVGEEAAAAAAVMCANLVPFNPLDNAVVGGVAAPAKSSDWVTVGDSAQSETALGKGWTPLRVLASGDVAFVRTITSRLSVDGTGAPVVTSYYDFQDFQVLYFWRKTLFTRFSQPDFTQVKASAATANRLLSEMIRLAQSFEDQEMFQAVAQLAKSFQVDRDLSDRSTFEFKTPVNVVPGLHRIKGNIVASTEFDTIVL